MRALIILLIPSTIPILIMGAAPQMQLDEELLSPGDILNVRIIQACDVKLLGENVSIQLFKGSSDHLELKVNTSGLEPGIYKIVNSCDGFEVEVSFTLDELYIEIISPEPNVIKVIAKTKLSGIVNASITVNGMPYNAPFKADPGEYHIEANFSGLRSSERIYLPEIYMRECLLPQDDVGITIKGDEKPDLKIVTPLNSSIIPDLERINSTHWYSRFKLPQPIALGNYSLIVAVGNVTLEREFEVTSIEIDYSNGSLKARDALSGEPVRGNVTVRSCFWNFTSPFDGSIELRGPAEVTINDERGLRSSFEIEGVSTDRDVYFPGDTLRVCSSGGNLIIRSPTGRVLLDSEVPPGIYKYPLVRDVEIGEYSIELNGVSRNFYVDSYSIDASFTGDYVEGRVSYYSIAPNSVSYLVLPSNLSGESRVTNGSFRICLPDSEEVILKCGNAEMRLSKNCSSTSLDGLRLEANGSCVNATKVEGGIYVSVRSHSNFTTILRVRGSEELEALSEDGKELHLRTRFSDGVQEFLLEDGSPNDPDGIADGLFNMILRPKSSEANKSIEKEMRKEVKRDKEPKIVKEILAKGSGKKWKVKFYRMEGFENLTGMFQLKDGLFVKEEEVGEDEGIVVRSELIADGKILVELGEKRGWVRVAVKLPKGALVEGVLAEDENGTREIDSWYQSGDTLIFYDDPNRYYYVLYGVPPWWDPDGVAQGYDWHYRVPLQLPALMRDHTIWLDVDFNYLLSLLNVTGTFDPNSVRVVDDQGNLVPNQEFVPLGSGFGRVKFILHKDLGGPSTFYIYFDIIENGAKPYLNTLNAGLDSGTLNYWTYGRNPSTIGSIIQASPPGPHTVYDPYGSPNYVTDDGNPVFGGYSLVLGYRTPSGSEDSTSTGEDTWAYYEFRVPADGGILYFWYRVESWDSANYDYFRAELRDTAGSTLATIVSNYNPNPGDNYGTFADSGWLSASFDLSPYAGQTVRAYFLVHTYSDDLYKTWAYVDNLTWAPVNLTSSLSSSMVEGFGVNITSPRGILSYGPLRVEARVDARPSSVIARIYNPLGALVTNAQLYDDGTNGDAVPNDGIYTNANAYFLSPGSPFGKWRVVVLANDSSTSIYPGYSGLIHIPGRPYEVNYTDFFNVDETYFYLGPVKGMVFEDREPLATLGSEDRPMGNVLVYAFEDDGDGVFEPLDDVLFTWGKTDSGGSYAFSIQEGRYFVIVNSRNLTAEINAGHSVDETWAEQTYQVEWNGSAYVGRAKYGGLDPRLSDSCLSLIFRDDFEVWQGWFNYGSGSVAQSNAEFYNGSYSLVRDANNEPNGGYKLIGATIGRGYILQGYAFRPIPVGVRSRVSVSLVDSNYNGYGFIVNHRFNRIQIARRTGGTATILSTLNYDPPDESWYFWKLILLTNNTIIFRLYDTDGNLLAQVRATDTTYNSFDRVLVQGDATYYIDTLVLWRIPDRCEHITEIETSNYMGESVDFGFSYEVIVNTRDEDDDPGPKSCQGCLRQFIMNSNAVEGMQKSYFLIPKSDPNYTQENLDSSVIDVWRIKLSSNLPTIMDDVNLTAKTQSGAHGFIEGKYVGLDNYRIGDFETPRIEVDGNGYEVFNASARKAQIEGFSIYNTPYAVIVRGSDGRYMIRDNFIGTYANGTNSLKVIFGISVGKYSTSIIASNLSAFIRHNIVTSGHYGIVVNSGNLANATIEDNWVRECGAGFSVGDGISLQTNGNKIVHNLIERNRNDGSTSTIDGGAGLELIVWVPEQSSGVNLVMNNTIINNSRWGVSVLSSYTKAIVEGNIISENQVGVIVSGAPVANVTKNSIFNNTRVGIDLDISGDPNGDDVSLNDGILSETQPNKGMDYPVITDAFLSGSTLQLKGYVGLSPSSTFANSIIDVYLVRNSTKGDDLIGNNLSGGGTLPDKYGEGWIWLGRLVADGESTFYGEITAPQVDCGSLITATATLNGTSEFGPDVHVICRRNVSASIRIRGDSAILNVTAHGSKQYNVIAYWIKPQNIDIASMSGDYDSYGFTGTVYWWLFNQIDAGETKHVYMTLSFSGDYNLMDAFNVGVDPPGLSINIREFATIKFNTDGSHDAIRLWGFLTVNNSSPDAISNLALDIDAPGYTFYLDYPLSSSTPISPPLTYQWLPPGSYVRWRYEGPPSEARVPLRISGMSSNCRTTIEVSALDDVSDVTIRGFGDVWKIGSMKKGERVSRTFRVDTIGCRNYTLAVEFIYANTSLLGKLRALRGSSDASVEVMKEMDGDLARVRASFRNEAKELIYNLTKVCIMRSQSGPVLACETPNVILRPGDAYESSYYSETVSGVPVYYSNASFTIVPSVSGVMVPLREIASGYYIATADLSVAICCAPPTAQIPVPQIPTTQIPLTTSPRVTKPMETVTTPPIIAPTATQTTVTRTIPTETKEAQRTIEVNMSLGSSIALRVGPPVLMVLGLPFILGMLLLRRRVGEVVVDYGTLSFLYSNGQLPKVSGMFRLAMTDITLLRVTADEELFNAILRTYFNVYPVESEELSAVLSLSPDPSVVEPLLARSLASRLNLDYFPDMLLRR